MKTIKQLLTDEIRPKIRLAEVERLIRRHRIIIPPLSRKTLQKMCEDGTFETAGSGPGPRRLAGLRRLVHEMDRGTGREK